MPHLHQPSQRWSRLGRVDNGRLDTADSFLKRECDFIALKADLPYQREVEMGDVQAPELAHGRSQAKGQVAPARTGNRAEAWAWSAATRGVRPKCLEEHRHLQAWWWAGHLEGWSWDNMAMKLKAGEDG